MAHSLDLHRMKIRLAKIIMERSYKEGDFTLTSGRKSNFYFDGKQTALHPEGSYLIGHLFNAMLSEAGLGNKEVTAIGGLTLGADPLVSATSLISYQLGRPMPAFIIRKSPKGHGTNQYIEGLSNLQIGKPVVLLEDVVTTGGSLLTACERVKDAGFPIAMLCTLLDREEGGNEAIIAAGYSLRSLFRRTELVQLAKSTL